MFAIGLFLVITASIFGGEFGAKRLEPYNWADKIGMVVFGSGLCLIAISTFIVLWQWLP